MVQITKTLKKSLKPPPSLQSLIEKFLSIPEIEIGLEIEKLSLTGKNGWIWQKTDMFHWIGVLNRFDGVLDSLISRYELPLKQSGPVAPADKYLLIQIIIFTMALWDNSTNRSLYNSYEHLINLLGVCEPDVLYWTLRLLMKPALRFNAQKSLKTPYTLAIPILTVLAQKDTVPTMTSLSYYRTAKELKDLNEPTKEASPETPSNPVAPAEGDKMIDTAITTAAAKYSPLVSIPIPSLENAGCDAILAMYKELKETFKVSVEQSRELLHKIRLVNMKDPELTSYFTAIRYCALVILAQLLPEEQAEIKLFMPDPELVTNACALIVQPIELPHSLRFIACSLVDGISHYRGKQAEVLGAINASANHGHVIQAIRKILDPASFESGELTSTDYNLEFIESLFNFISYIMSSSSGGNMLTSAGLVPILQSCLAAPQTPIKIVSKCIVMLDMIQSDTPTTQIEVGAIVERIKTEVDYCLGLKSGFKEEDLVYSTIPDPGTHLPFRELLARTPLLRSMMKLILHLQQTSATSDSMRRLIDSSLPQTLKTIFKESKLFCVGVGVFGLAVNIMSTFVHTEPTSLTILQEQGVVSSFLEASQNEIPPSPEVVSALPNAFGAICLNTPGLDAFIAANPIPKFLAIFTLKQHLPSLIDNDVPHLVGNSIDELIRHHPTTRDIIMKAVVELVEQVALLAQEFGSDAGCRLLVDGEPEETSPAEFVSGTDIKIEMDDSRAAQYIDVLSRFIEGLFQNTAHCKEFIKFGGLKPLLSLYSLPSLPFDFATSSSSASVSYLFRTIVDVNGAESTPIIYEAISQVCREIDECGMFQGSGDESVFLSFINVSASDSPELKLKAQSCSRKLVILKCYLRLLNDVYCSNSLSHSKSIASLIDLFSPERPYSLLTFFGHAARVSSLERLIVASKVPEGWYKSPDKKDIATKVVEGADSSAGKNSKFIFTLLDDIPLDISAFFRGILKTISHRRVLSESSRKVSQEMIDQLAYESIEALSWSRGVQSDLSYDYLILALSHLRGLICEERGSGSLFQAYVAFSISRKATFSSILQLAKTLIDEKLPPLLAEKSEPLKKEAAEKSISKLAGVVDIISDIFQCLVSDKYQQESPHTATLYARLKDNGANSFDPVAFLVQMRLDIFPVFSELFQSSQLSNLSNYAINRIVGTILLVLKHEGEQSSVATRNAGPTAASGLPFSIAALSQQIFGNRAGHGAPPVAIPLVPAPAPRADPAKIDILCDMGFPRPAAEIALIRCGNSVSRAADYLLNHPEVLSQQPAAPPAGPSVSSATAAVPAADGNPPQTDIPAPSDATPTGPSGSAENAGPLASSNDASVEVNDAMQQDPTDEQIEESSDFVVEEPPLDAPENGKGKEVDKSIELKEKNLEKLVNMRAEKSEAVYERALSLLSELDNISLVFGLKELVCLESSKVASIASKIIASLTEYHDLISSGVYEGDEPSLKKVTTALYLHYHMLALLVSDSKTSKAIEIQKSVLSSVEFSSLSPLALLSRVTDCQLWLSPLLLVLESYVSHCDEPTEVALRADPAQFRQDMESKVDKISLETRNSMILDLIRILKFESLDVNSLHVLLRLIARMTLKWPVALSFVENGGFQSLFNAEKFALFPTHQSIVMIIARHCLEDPAILQSLMKEELKRFLKHPRPRSVDLAFLIKSCGHIVVRSTEDFIAAVGSVCKLNSYSLTPSVRTMQVSLNENALVDPPADEKDIGDITKTPSATPFKFSSNSKLEDLADVSKVVQFLTGQLISLKHKEPSTNRYIALCFSLQSLCELFVSFPKAKVDFVKSSMRKSNKQTPKQNSSKNLLIGYLLHEVVPVDLLPSEVTGVSKDEMEQRFASIWAAQLLSALCYAKKGYLDDPYPAELQAIRVLVVESLLKALKDSINQSDSIAFEIRYGKIVSLASLCSDLLNPQVIVTNFEAGSLEAHSLTIAKIMIEKGFVGVFTSALASLDVNHPCSSKVVLSFLKPLDKLASAAIKIGKLDVSGGGVAVSAKTKKTPSLFDNALRDLEDEGSAIEQTPNEISDMFRNSALGMLEPSLGNEGDSGDSDESGEEDEFDEFDEMDDNEMDDDEMDEDSDADDDMEIVVPHPYHGAQDDEGEGETSSDDDISPLQNPFIDQSGNIEPVIEVESDSDEDESDEDPDDDDEDPEDVEMFLENHMHNNGDTGDEEDEEDQYPEEDGDDEDGGEPMTLAQLMSGGGHTVPPDADLADIEDVFGQDNGNMMLEEADDEDEEDDEGVDQGLGPAGFIMAHRRMQQVFGNLGNGIELEWHQGQSGGRVLDPANFPLLSDRPPNAAVVQDMTHPLLVNQESNFVGTNPNSRNAASNGRHMMSDADEAGTIQIELLEQLLMNSTRPGHSMIRPPNASLFSQGSQRSLSLPQPPTALSELEQQKLNIQNFTLAFTDDRWKQDSKLQYGNFLLDKAVKTGNAILNRLLPAAYEVKMKEDREKEEKKRIEEEKRKEEEEKKRVEEEEKRKAELAAAPEVVPPSEQDEDVEMAPATSSAEPAEAVPSTEAVQEERIVVMIDGNPFDITGSGIDVTFLEALPDELRMEVVNQHFRERELSRARDEIGAASELNPEFLDALPFEIREEVIRQERLEAEQREASARRAARATEAAATAASGAPTIPRGVIPVTEEVDPISSSSKSKSAAAARESIQLVESSNIASLLRLVFFPDPTTKDGIYALLSHLCQNSKSRSDIVGLLISVLNAGSTDLASVDKTFAQLTLKTSKLSSSTINKDDSAAGPVVPEPADFVPNMVAQRCLEALIHLTSSVSSVGKYFLTETEPVLPLMKTPKSKKSKGKEKISHLVYPVIQLLNLLEQPSLLSNSSALEKLMHLLSNVLRPLSHIAKKKFATIANPEKALSAVATVEDTGVGVSASSDVGKSSEVTKAESMSETSLKEKDPKPDIKLPILAESSVCNVVKVLKDGTTSSRSFQFTLSVIQYLCSYPAHLNIVVLELLNSAQSLGDSMLEEIDLLLQTLKAHSGESTSLNSMILEKFTSVGATQAKLLRILKTIDFLFSKTNDVALKFPYITAIDQFKSVKEDALPSDVEVLDRLYDQLKFGKLWQKLGETMAIIDRKENFIHVGTVLLPFIEAFMVVSKPSVSIMKRLHNSERGNLPFVVLKQQSEISEMEPDGFILFAESNKRVLNTMVRNNPSLMNGSFALLVQNPKVLEFDNKRTYFNQQLHKGGRRNHQQIQINVRRQYVFEESYQQLQGRSGDAIKYGKLHVRFRDEEGVDAGGVTREWFSALALQMFNPDYALFRPSAADRVTYQPNRASEINPDHLFYFKFVGRIIGKAIYDGRLLDAHFTRSFYKCMISAPVDHKDMEAIDPEFYKSLDWILHNNITDVLDLNFSLEVDDFGRRKIIDLKEDGRNVPVTEANKNEYVRLVTEQKLVVAIQDQIQAFLSGFHEIIPKDLIKIFNEQELELLISGLPDIDIDDWKNNTEYQNYTASAPQIQWFWRAVRSFSQEERAKLIQFATGTSKVPLGGFTQLQGSNGIQKFQIHKEFSSTTRLPSAHTCFNQIDLPQYESYEQLRSLLLIAINESEGFGFA